VAVVFDLCRNRHVAGHQLIRREVDVRFHQVCVDEKEFDAALTQDLFYALAVEALRRPLHAYRILPLACRAIGAFGDPDAARPAPKEPLMRLSADPYLRADGFVGPKQREISVRSAAGDDLDLSGIVEVPEGADQVAVVTFEIV